MEHILYSVSPREGVATGKSFLRSEQAERCTGALIVYQITMPRPVAISFSFFPFCRIKDHQQKKTGERKHILREDLIPLIIPFLPV